MARIRSVHPEFWEDEEIGALSRDARLLYVGTWNLADDEGLLRWAAPYLKASIFMYDDDLTVGDVEKLMAELVDEGFVFAYRGGKTQQSLGWIPSFRRHQKPNRPQPSKLPPPSLQNPAVCKRYAERDNWTCQLCGEEIPQAFGNVLDGGLNEALHGLSMDHTKPRAAGGTDYPSNIRAAHRRCNSSKRDRVSDSPTDAVSDSLHDSVNESVNDSPPEGRGEEGRGEEEGRAADDPPALTLVPDPVLPPAADEPSPSELAAQRFEDHFWPAYPRRNGKRVGKPKALAQWKKLKVDEQRAAVMGARNYAAACNGGLQFAKDPERWLRDRCWEDWQTPAVPDQRRPVEQSTGSFPEASSRW